MASPPEIYNARAPDRHADPARASVSRHSRERPVPRTTGRSLPVCLEPRTGRARDGYRKWQGVRQAGDGPGSPTFFTLGQRFTQLGNVPGNEWLQDYNHEFVRYACKYMGDAYAAFINPNMPDHGRPQYKANYYTQPAFTIPSKVRIRYGHLYFPKMGWTRLGPVLRYVDGKPLTVPRQARVGRTAAASPRNVWAAGAPS